MATLTTLNAATPLDASDTTRTAFTASVVTETLTFALDNTDADFGTMDTLTYSVQYRMSGAPTDDTFDLDIRIMNGATVLAAGNSGGTVWENVVTTATSTTDAYNAVTGFTYVNTTADKTTWDGASVELRQTVGKTKGWDGVVIEANHAIFDGTYTAAVANTDVVMNLASLTVTGPVVTIVRQIPVAMALAPLTLAGQAATTNTKSSGCCALLLFRAARTLNFA